MGKLFPQILATLQQPADFDLYGQASYQPKISVKVGVVRLRGSSVKSSVRADSSASRGRVDEAREDAVLLFEPHVLPMEGALVTIFAEPGFTLRVIGVEPRFTLSGKLAHYQVTLQREIG